MPRCSCAGSVCNCRIVAGPGIAISGAGSAANPYVIEGEGGVGGSLQVIDSPTVDLVASGSGTLVDPMVLQANATVSMQELENVEDGAASIGEVPIWTGSQFEFGIPAAAPPGSVATACGLDGDGSGGNPLRVQGRTGAQWTSDGFAGTPASAGSPLYCDGASEGAFGPPRHTSVRSSQNGDGTDRLAPAAPAFSTITGSFTVSITNSTPRQMQYALHSFFRYIMTWTGTGPTTGDMHFSISEDGGPAVLYRATRNQGIPGMSGGVGMGDFVPGPIRDGFLAAGASKSFLVGMVFQRVSGTDPITFTSINSRILLQGWTV